jgi:hypothetical protein
VCKGKVVAYGAGLSRLFDWHRPVAGGTKNGLDLTLELINLLIMA